MSRTGRHDPGAHSPRLHTKGLILDRGWRYDLEVWFSDTFVLHGRIGALRRRVLDLADLSAGQDLLDVGCGTGTLAIDAARRWSGAGRVAGVDPGRRQIDRARSKARRAGVSVDFREGVIEDLPFPGGSFDAVTSTLMMHHLPADVRTRGLAEITRVLRPNGRVLIVDFDLPEGSPHDAEPAQNEDGEVGPLMMLLSQSGFTDISTEHIPFRRSHRGWSGASLTWAVRG